MNIFKKLLMIFVSICFIFSLVACSSQEANIVTVASKYKIPQNEYKEFFDIQSDEKHDLIFENGIIGATINETNVYYIGKLKDNKAYGLGTALYVYTYLNNYGYICM